jgi:hypothetical protein
MILSPLKITELIPLVLKKKKNTLRITEMIPSFSARKKRAYTLKITEIDSLYAEKSCKLMKSPFFDFEIKTRLVKPSLKIVGRAGLIAWLVKLW